MSRVFIVVDEKNRVIQIEGEATLENIADLSSAILVEQGASCPRLDYAQALYIGKPLTNEDAICLYKFDGEKIVERTADEIAADVAAMPAPEPTEVEMLRADVDFLLMLMEG